MSHTYEVEIKSLLGEEQNANTFREKLAKKYPNLTKKESYSQLNHYFEGGDLNVLCMTLEHFLTKETLNKVRLVAEKGSKVSVRSREMNGKAKFVLKASVGDDSSENGVARIEIEEEVKCSLDELDKQILAAGCSYQAKWSREREEYEVGDVTVCLDKNAGYGYVAEFEKVVLHEDLLNEAKASLLTFMDGFEVEELAQDRLERMFAYYNAHWPEYYGTERVFVVE